MLLLPGKKLKMTHLYNESGALLPVTIIYFGRSIIKKISSDSDLFDLVEVSFCGSGSKSIYNSKGNNIFKVKKSKLIEVGSSVSLNTFLTKGDRVSVSGVTTGKGFAGVMKRWNFSGLESSHGVSISHRSHGSTGQRQDPGKVFKGKKMAGHMGCETITVKNLEILDIDEAKSFLVVKGSIPGKMGNQVFLKMINPIM